jgi:hypothetical protein
MIIDGQKHDKAHDKEFQIIAIIPAVIIEQHVIQNRRYIVALEDTDRKF